MSTADWLMVGAAIAAGGFIIAHFLRKRPASTRKAPSAPPVPLGGSVASGAAYGLQSAAAAQRPTPWPERESVAKPIRPFNDRRIDDDLFGEGGIDLTVPLAEVASLISDSDTSSSIDTSDSFTGGGGDFGGGGASGSWE